MQVGNVGREMTDETDTTIEELRGMFSEGESVEVVRSRFRADPTTENSTVRLHVHTIVHAWQAGSHAPAGE